MSDLVTWLRAQLDEDETDAQRRDFHTGTCSRFLDPGGDCSCDYSDHVLAEVEAKRRILDWAVRAGEVTEEDCYNLGCEDVIRLLALPYADRPGYLEEWRP